MISRIQTTGGFASGSPVARPPLLHDGGFMFRRLVHTADDLTLTLLRLGLGVIFFAHGAQKMLGWFGGYGYAATLNMFTQNMGLPEAFAVLAIVAEFFGGIGLILGLFSRIAAFGIACNMLVAIFLVHLPNGLFMNWTGTQRGEGIEFHILALCIAVTLVARGAGALSFDRLIEGGSGRSMPVGYHPMPSRL
jgi:putative oxidoreductase